MNIKNYFFKCLPNGIYWSFKSMMAGNYIPIQGHEGQEQVNGKIVCNHCEHVMHDPEEYRRYEWCKKCDHCIVKADDDAYVCIECGGRNRRLPHYSAMRGIFGRK